MERKLASIQRIAALNPIEGADRIEVATIQGWRVVCQKGLYKVNDLACYFEIDSFIPNAVAPFLTKPDHFPKVYNEVEGERLKTIKLRGQVSQGRLLPLWEETIKDKVLGLEEGTDLTELLGIQKWEPALPAQLAGQAKGMFPSFIRKTDQERIQNLVKFFDLYRDELFEVSVKLDGSSMTVYQNGEDFGVCSRNINLKETEGNSFWDMTNKLNLREILGQLGKNVAIQGELIGEGIQGNPEGIKGQEFRVFDIWDIDNYRYCTPEERANILLRIPGIKEVPILEKSHPVFQIYGTVDKLLAYAEGPSLYAKSREGLVFKSCRLINGETVSFKAISNSYLLKRGD